MLFYQSEVNQQRMGVGSATINGLWFSGFGRLPSVGKGYGTIYSTLPLAKGLAQLSNTVHYELQNSFDKIQDFAEETILTDTRFTDSKRANDLSQWEDALIHLDHGLSRMLKSRTCEELSIYNCMGKAFNVNRQRLRKGFWKPNKNIVNIVCGRIKK
jgi:hypothetical protein